ncbi:TerC family protein [Anaeromyxobacter oryzae]|uniref:Membrane protein n=1 Tax=Anaeromyxobacter oryzae TaxID=2918170 RepID=A0ABN6N137_9BACT|nr:TerC family protein [Anaeromyxobacter oryzae]BDG06881.1 membrane protein [Anaeromyxobacter oryzae]
MDGIGTPWLWGGFLALVLALLALDLGVFHRKDRAITAREALSWTVVWIVLSLAFCGFIGWRYGGDRAVEYLTGYLIEKSLSVDNLFVFVLVFASFRIPPRYQHRVLFWGILSALVLRAGMILGGSALLQRFGWLVYVFGAFLVVTGVRLLRHSEAEHDPSRSWAFRVIRRVVPATTRIEGHHFFVREAGRHVATPLFLALALIEVSDVVFALDSIPAIFGVTLDPFIVFTSNIFAILGLRSLYFAMASLLGRFEFLKVGLALVLVFIGLKMTLSAWVHVPSAVSLGVVGALLGGSIAVSLRKTRDLARGGGHAAGGAPPGRDGAPAARRTSAS